MSIAKDGDKVRVHYTGRLEDGQVFDSSLDREPLEFTLGQGQVIPGFENGIRGMTIGEKKSVTLLPEEAYGPRHKENIVRVRKDMFPPDIVPEVGGHLQVQGAEGNHMNVVVSAIEGEIVTLDANHPLAGKTLIFDVELIEIAA